MAARTPAEICALFQRAMAEGDLDAVLSLYDAAAVFVRESGEATRTRDELRQELAPLADQAALRVRRAAGRRGRRHGAHAPRLGRDRAATTAFTCGRGRAASGDGTWRWLIGDPFTVGKRIVT